MMLHPIQVRAGLIAVLGLLPACAGTSRQHDVLAEAAAAMGGQTRIEAVKRLALEGEGTAYALGQNRTHESELLSWRVTDYRRDVDYGDGRWREQSVRTPTFVTGWPAPFTLVEGYDAGLACDVEDGAASRRDSVVARARRAELYHDPVGLLRAVATGELRPVRSRSDTAELTTAGSERLTLIVDRATHLPRRIVSRGHEPALGDVDLVTELDSFVQVEGLKLPTRLRKRVDTTLVADLHISRAVVDPAPGDLRAPVEVATAAEPADSVRVTVTEEAAGVWYLAGEGHHSVVVELADHLTLIEAPLDDIRAGSGPQCRRGLRVITHGSNRRFFEAAVTRPSTVRLDALARQRGRSSSKRSATS